MRCAAAYTCYEPSLSILKRAMHIGCAGRLPYMLEHFDFVCSTVVSNPSGDFLDFPEMLSRCFPGHCQMSSSFSRVSSRRLPDVSQMPPRDAFQTFAV